MTADPEAVARAEFESHWRDDAPADAAANSTTDVVVHDPRRPTPGEGREAYRAFVDAERVRFRSPDLTVERAVVVDDTAVLFVGGSYAPDTDGSADRREVTGVQVSRVADGAVAERWGALVDRTALERLDADTAGAVVVPDDPAYDETRAVWNGTVDRYPTVVVRATDVADVRAALAFARDNDLFVAVRGGGHNVAGTAVWDAGLVVDCSAMTATRVDPEARTVWVGAGATWADVDHATQAFGLAVPGGVVSDTGVAGLTLGGGVGHLRHRHGLSCDALRAVELVAPDGRYLTTSEETRPELFWGLRGGGGNFGVVTGFVFECYPVGPEVATAFVVYHEDDREDCLRAYREFAASSPDEVSTLAFAGAVPDEDPFPEARCGEGMVAFFGCHSGDVAAGTAALDPLGRFADPIADFSGPMPYAEFQQALDEEYPDGMRYYWTSRYLHSLPDEAVALVGEWADRAPSALSTVDVWPLGGEIARVDPDETAFVGREAAYLLGVEANWTNEADDAANVEWARACAAAFDPFTDGSVYPNFPGGREEGDDVVRATFGERRERLAALKGAYDPENRLRSNLNVVPSGG